MFSNIGFRWAVPQQIVLHQPTSGRTRLSSNDMNLSSVTADVERVASGPDGRRQGDIGRSSADTRVVRRPRSSSQDVYKRQLLYLERRRGPSADYGLPGGLRRVYLYHVRKTGGSSLFGSFLALGGEDPRDVEERMGASFLRTTTSGMYVFCLLYTSRCV